MVNPPDNHTEAGNGDFAQVYREQRRTYYQQFPTFWGTVFGERHEEYATYGALEISCEHADALRIAASRLYQLLTRLVGELQRADRQTLLEIGVPPITIPYVQTVIPEMPAVMCGRFEFAMTATGPKMLEFNAETPTFVVELFQINSRVCADFGLIDPNAHCQEQLTGAIRTTLDAAVRWVSLRRGREASVVFCSFADNREERGTTEFYLSLASKGENLPYHLSYRGLDQLRVTRDKLLTAEGEQVDVLYKLYPTEYMIEDEAPDGMPVGLELLELVRKRHLAVINPPSSFLLQNKALMAVLWAMHLSHSKLFTAEEHQWIAQYLLPTYLHTADTSEAQLFAGRHVVKPVYGREGASITVRESHEIIERSEDRLYDDQVMIAQQYAALPTTMIQTEEGRVEVNLVHNCFVVAGVPSAIGVRGSRRLIFDDSSYFLPVCYPR